MMDKKVVQSWLNDLLALADTGTDKKDFSYPYLQGNESIKTELKPYAKQILAEITDRDFKNIDDALNAMSKYPFSATVEEPWLETKASAEELADFIAYFCNQKHIYWDNTIRDPHGIEYFEKTLLGKALLKFDCFLAPSRSKPVVAAPTITTRAGSSRIGMPPKDDYKTSGGRSGDVRDLIGEPHEKFILSSYCPVMYMVEGKMSTGTAPFAYIRPLEIAGAKDTTNSVFFGTSWKAYRNFICYFDKLDDAEKFAEKVRNRFRAISAAIFVSKTKTDRNGYFKVGTEFGQVFIRAKNLNEMLEELESDKALEESDSSFIDLEEDDAYPNEGKLIIESGDFEEFAKWSSLYD